MSADYARSQYFAYFSRAAYFAKLAISTCLTDTELSREYGRRAQMAMESAGYYGKILRGEEC